MKCNRIGKILTFTFADDVPTITFDTSNLTDAINEDARMHGIEQKTRDNAAIARKDAKTGVVINVTEAMRAAAVQEMVDRLNRGVWNEKSARIAPQNPTILAIAAKRGCTYAEAEAHIAATMLAELGGE